VPAPGTPGDGELLDNGDENERMTDPLRALVVADTHLKEGQSARLIERLRGADLTCDIDAVFHAGDLVHPDVLDAPATIPSWSRFSRDASRKT
jgi:hypothetical protein